MRMTVLAATIGGVLLAAGPAVAMSCAERIVYVRTIIDKDLKIGFIGAEVHEQMTKDLQIAGDVCRSGQDARAQLLISVTQQKHGYPVRP